MNLKKSLEVETISTLKSTPRLNDFAEFEGLQDIEIWRKFNDGNSAILIYIYHKYVGQLLRFGIQFTPREVVKDSIQDLFLYLKQRKNSTVEVKNIAAYLYKSLHRIIIKKSNLSKSLSSVDQIPENQKWRITASNEVSIIEKEVKKEQTKKLQSSLQELSAKQRQALLLYYYEGFTHQEITDIMELKNKSSVRKLIFRAIDSLKDNFSL